MSVFPYLRFRFGWLCWMDELAKQVKVIKQTFA